MFFKKRAETVNTTAPIPPSPQVVRTSGDYDGNDGEWSTFYINVGDKDGNGGGQNFKVLPSTWFSVTLVPEPAEWCNADCAQARGVGKINGDQVRGLNTDSSSTWKQAAIADLDLPYWWTNKTDDLRGEYGLDYLGIGQTSHDSLIARSMYVVGTITPEFYLGQFGLSYWPMNVGGGKGAVASILATFNGTASIPSASYGYTAGARYRRNNVGVLGSLVLGGYDETRINPDNRVQIHMPDSHNTSLVVGVQSMTHKPDSEVEANAFSLTQDNVKAFSATIDSTLPYLVLPDKVCDHLATRFNLIYREESNMYTINSTGASRNERDNATVSFKIGGDPFGTGPEFATIRLPWAAFNKKYTDPENTTNSTPYVPIKKSKNGMFVLGRTFLQEAYIVVDYERQNFTVAQVPFLDTSPDPKVVAIYNTTYSTPTPTPIPTGGGSKGLSGGAIAGIVVGILVVALGAALGIFLWWKKRRERKNAPPTYKESTEIDTSLTDEAKRRRASELDAEPPGLRKPRGLGGFYGHDGNREDSSPFPAISEMDSPPAELYSPPVVASTPHSEGNSTDYFTVSSKLGRRGATRESSANNTPGTPPPFTPIAELPGDDGRFPSGGQQTDMMLNPKVSPLLASASIAKRDPSATRSQGNIDEVMKRHSAEPSPAPPAKDEPATEGAARETKKPETDAEGEELERRPSHTRGLSDTTVQSESTVVSQPTPEELEQWAVADNEHPRRPLSE